MPSGGPVSISLRGGRAGAAGAWRAAGRPHPGAPPLPAGLGALRPAALGRFPPAVAPVSAPAFGGFAPEVLEEGAPGVDIAPGRLPAPPDLRRDGASAVSAVEPPR